MYANLQADSDANNQRKKEVSLMEQKEIKVPEVPSAPVGKRFAILIFAMLLIISLFSFFFHP